MRRFFDIITQLLGLILIIVAFYVALSDEWKQNSQYYVFHLPSAILICFILIGILFFSQGLARVFQLSKALVFKSPSKLEAQLNTVQKNLKGMSEAFYTSGSRGLKEEMRKKRVPKVWNIVFNQLESKIVSSDIRLLIQYSARNFESNINQQIHILSSLAALAPSVGVLGTVMGLIKLLGNLKDFSSLGSNMSLALITTLYGVFFGTIVFRPLISRLENIKKIELHSYEQALFWVQLIDQKKPSFYFDPKYFDLKLKKKD